MEWRGLAVVVSQPHVLRTFEGQHEEEGVMDEGLNDRLGQPQEKQQVRKALCRVTLRVVCDNVRL